MPAMKQTTPVDPADAGAGDSTPVLITPASRLSLGTEMAANAVAAPAEASWPAANRAIYVPFELEESVTVLKLFIFNGFTVSGNVDLGIYNSVFTRLVSSGSIAQTGVSSLQEFDIADTVIGPGQFYLALAVDNIDAILFRWLGTGAVAVELLKSWGLAQEASAFPLPATATPVSVSSDYIPYVGLSLRSLVA